VELVHGPVDREQVERAQRADLVDAARETAAAEHERGLRAPATPLGSGTSAGRIELDDLAHRRPRIEVALTAPTPVRSC